MEEPDPEPDPDPEPKKPDQTEEVLSSKLNGIKRQLVLAFNEAQSDVLRERLLGEMERLTGKKLTIKNQSQPQNKTRKIVSNNDALSIFNRKLFLRNGANR